MQETNDALISPSDASSTPSTPSAPPTNVCRHERAAIFVETALPLVSEGSVSAVVDSPPNKDESVKYTWKTGIKWRESLGWGMIDFSNSIYLTVVVSAIYAPFFVNYVSPINGATMWSLSMFVPTVLSIILTPYFGATIDLRGHKLIWLSVTILVYSICAGLLFFVSPYQLHNHVVFCLVLLIVARFAFNTNEFVCASLLPYCVRDQSYLGMVSGMGWGIGYLGGTIAVGIVTFLILAPDSSPEYASSVQLGMLVTGILSLLSAVPVIVALRYIPSEGTITEAPSVHTAGRSVLKAIQHRVRQTFAQLWCTFREMCRHRDLIIFLVCFFVYMIGVQAIVGFLSIYASDTIRLDSSQIAIMFVIIQITAALGSALFGLLEVKIGPKGVLICTLCLWTVAVTLCIATPELCASLHWNAQTFFIIITSLAGMALGPSQSCSRTLFALLIPEALSGEAFSVWEMILNLSTLVAALYGPIADLSNSRVAAASMASTFLIGVALVLFLKVDRGKLEKAKWEEALLSATSPPVVSA